MPKRIEVPSDEPLPPGAKVLDEKELSDVTGITAKTSFTEGTKLVTQFGLIAVFSAFILTVCGSLLYFGRLDLLNSVKDTNTIHLQMFRELREDAKEDRTDNKAHQQRMWQQLRDLTTATQEGNKLLTKSADILSKNSQVMEENHSVFLRMLAEQKRANEKK